MRSLALMLALSHLRPALGAKPFISSLRLSLRCAARAAVTTASMPIVGAAPAHPIRPPSKFVPFPFEYHEEIELTIDGLTNLGDGVGRVQLASGEGTDGSSSSLAAPSPELRGGSRGWVVMVPFALPGERVRVRVFRNHAGHSSADLVEVLTPSAQRQEPVCPLFGACGGCQYQHLRYDAQLAMKGQQIEELLVRVGNLSASCGGEEALRSLVQPPVGLARKQYGYRTKLTPHYNVPRAGEELLIGFIRHGVRSQMVDVPACPIATEAINAALPGAREAARAKLETTEAAFAIGEGKKPKGATLLLRHAFGADGEPAVVSDHHASVSEVITLPGSAAVGKVMEAAGRMEVEQELIGNSGVDTDGGAGLDSGALKLTFKAGDFFQNNPFVVPLMVQYVLDEVRTFRLRMSMK
eukprot:scaffold103782_cov30-Tisochrysis_lutea.AAC.1